MRAVVNEALTNVNRHANATVVLVSLRYEPDRSMSPSKMMAWEPLNSFFDTFQDSYLHFGLRHISQMVMDRGGSFSVTNGEEAGLVVRVSIPLPTKQP